MPPLPTLREPITDGVVALRMSAEHDIPEVLIAYQDDPALHLRLGEARPPSGAELGRRCEQAELRREAGESMMLSILEPGSDTCHGEIRVHNLDWQNLRAELGVWVAVQRRGAGLARRALALVAPWLLRECGLERVGLFTEADNAAMISAARGAGFRQEGTLRGYTLEQGRRVDNVALSLVRGDVLGAPGEEAGEPRGRAR